MIASATAIAAFIVTSQLNPSGPIQSPASLSAIRQFEISTMVEEQCAKLIGEKYASQKEAADIIARATVSKCELPTYRDEVIAALIERGLGPARAEQEASGIIESTRAKRIDRVIGDILDARSKRLARPRVRK